MSGFEAGVLGALLFAGLTLAISSGLRPATEQLKRIADALDAISRESWAGDEKGPLRSLADEIATIRRAVAPTHAEIDEEREEWILDPSPDEPVRYLANLPEIARQLGDRDTPAR